MNADKRTDDAQRLTHPLLRQIADLAATAAGMRLVVVYPTPSGWGEIYGDAHRELQPAFCHLFRGSRDGARHCRMCHILMTVAACGGSPLVQRCHAGANVLVCPASSAASESTAIVSSCMFADESAWPETAARGQTLGLDARKLRKAFRELPRLDDRQRDVMTGFMTTMSLAVQTIRRTMEIEQRLNERDADRHRPALDRELEDLFATSAEWALNRSGRLVESRDGHAPLLVRVVCELVRQRPDLPLTVKELATAARVSPNHLTTLIGQWAGKSFTELLTEQRIERAKNLLGNVTLNINQVAALVGYDDPGYFARRFKQQTGFTPRDWRARVPDAASNAA